MQFRYFPLVLVVFLTGSSLVLSSCDSSGSNGDNSGSDSDPDVTVTAAFTVEPAAPEVGDEVTLDGSDSSVEDADELSYEWELSGPDESAAVLDDSEAEETFFEADVAGTYEVSLEVAAGDARDDAAETVQVEEGESEGENDRLHWSVNVGEYLGMEPTLGPDGNIYVGASGGGLVAVDSQGVELWSKQDLQVRTASLSTDGNTLFVGAEASNQLVALDAETGDVQWTFDDDGSLGSAYHTALDEAGGVVYVVADQLHAVDRQAATPEDRALWSTGGPEMSKASKPAVSADRSTVYAGSSDGRLVAFSTADGEKQWEVEVNTEDDRLVASSPAIGESGTVYVGSTDGAVYAISPDGSVDWIFDDMAHPVDGDIALAPNGDRIYAVTNSAATGENDRLYAIDANGNQLWRTTGTAPSPPSASPVVGENGVVYYNNSTGVIAIDSQGERQWTYGTDDFVYGGPILSEDGMLYVGSWDENLYALKTEAEGVSTTSPWPLMGQNVRRAGLQSD